MVGRFSFFGAVGFGLGVMGALTVIWVPFIVGAVGGLFLGIPFGDPKKAVALALLESFAFGIGSVVGFFVFITIRDPIGIALVWLIGGSLAGAALGVFMKSPKGVLVLSVCGALSFGVGAWVVFRCSGPRRARRDFLAGFAGFLCDRRGSGRRYSRSDRGCSPARLYRIESEP